VFETPDDAIVVGGGLASIDVVKVLMLETTRSALRRRGIDVDLVEMETAGIPETLAKHDLRWEDLGLRGCTLFYRRRVDDMPLVEAPPGADEARMAKIAVGRRKTLEKAMRKYLFRFSPTMAPKELIVEGDRLAGIRFQRTRIEGGKVIEVPGETVAARGSAVISSIGSIPEAIAGVPMKVELIRFADWRSGA
jgi:NADPH-dependent glutamate synthase beta subunit-like oxidoreductase